MRTALLAAAVASLLGIAPALAGEPKSQTVTVGARSNMEATLYTPDGPGPYATILLMHTSLGITENDREYCARLAREGFICIAPAYYRAYGITGETRRYAFSKDSHSIMVDFVEIIQMLGRQPKAKPNAAGAIGFSAGGFFTGMLAVEGRVKAGVSYYGTFSGARTHPGLEPFQRCSSQSAPLLILAGERDATVGREPLQMDSVLNACGAPHELKVYTGATHDFERSFSVSANRAAADDAWPRTLAFFRQYLR
jgi:carboxymethylenebutenolidase